jgi:hypothetical protein
MVAQNDLLAWGDPELLQKVIGDRRRPGQAAATSPHGVSMTLWACHKTAAAPGALLRLPPYPTSDLRLHPDSGTSEENNMCAFFSDAPGRTASMIDCAACEVGVGKMD